MVDLLTREEREMERGGGEPNSSGERVELGFLSVFKCEIHLKDESHVTSKASPCSALFYLFIYLFFFFLNKTLCFAALVREAWSHFTDT